VYLLAGFVEFDQGVGAGGWSPAAEHFGRFSFDSQHGSCTLFDEVAGKAVELFPYLGVLFQNDSAIECPILAVD
jgi:hypothetical protein